MDLSRGDPFSTFMDFFLKVSAQINMVLYIKKLEQHLFSIKSCILPVVQGVWSFSVFFRILWKSAHLAPFSIFVETAQFVCIIKINPIFHVQ